MVEDYDDSKIQRACLLSAKEVDIAHLAMERCGLTSQVDSLDKDTPLFSFKADRGGSTIETSLRTLEEVAVLLPEFDASALAELKAGKPNLHLQDSRNGVPINVQITLTPPDADLPDVPSLPVGMLPGAKEAKLGLLNKER